MQVVTLDNVRIVQFQAPIYFANADIFVKSVVKLTGIDPVKARKKQKQFNQIETNISPVSVVFIDRNPVIYLNVPFILCLLTNQFKTLHV